MLPLLLACHGRAPNWESTPPPDPRLVALAFPAGPGPFEQRYESLRTADGAEVREAVVERWVPGDAPWTWVVTMTVDGREAARTPAALGEQGLAWTGSGVPLVNGTYDAPKVILPSPLEDGRTWTATHNDGFQTTERSCTLRSGSPYCADGWMVRCDSTAGTTVIIREHWCPGIGWRGYEVRAFDGCRPMMEEHSLALEFGGEALPDPDIAVRGLPSPAGCE